MPPQTHALCRPRSGQAEVTEKKAAEALQKKGEETDSKLREMEAAMGKSMQALKQEHAHLQTQFERNEMLRRVSENCRMRSLVGALSFTLLVLCARCAVLCPGAGVCSGVRNQVHSQWRSGRYT